MVRKCRSTPAPLMQSNDFSSPNELEQRGLAFQSHYELQASPFNWTFTRHDLDALLAKMAAQSVRGERTLFEQAVRLTATQAISLDEAVQLRSAGE